MSDCDITFSYLLDFIPIMTTSSASRTMSMPRTVAATSLEGAVARYKQLAKADAERSDEGNNRLDAGIVVCLHATDPRVRGVDRRLC